MNAPASTSPQGLAASWRDLVKPKEHGSWSLAFEPLALALLVAPSRPGFLLGIAIIVAFFLRRPVKIACRETRPARRAAARRITLAGAVLAFACAAAAVLVGNIASTLWLIPSALGGVFFLAFDLRNAGREQTAEAVGAAAFAFLPAAFAVLAGWSAAEALALGAIMIGRAVPTVLTVRAALRNAKSVEHHHCAPVLAGFIAVAAGFAFSRVSLVPSLVPWLLAVLAFRTCVLLLVRHRPLRASAIGMFEAVNGVAFVATVALAFRLG
jgi:hypothetical protein